MSHKFIPISKMTILIEGFFFAKRFYCTHPIQIQSCVTTCTYSVWCVSGSNNVVRMNDARSNARCKLDFYLNNVYNFALLVEDSRGIHLRHELERGKKKEFTARDIYTVWAIISPLAPSWSDIPVKKESKGTYTFNVFEFLHWLVDSITNTTNRGLVLRQFEN